MGRSVPLCLNQLQLRFSDTVQVSEALSIPVRCERCGVLLKVPRWIVRRRVRLHFCGSACREAWATVLPDDGERLLLRGRPQFRGGNWKVQTALARERDGFRCRNCKVT
ncbi:MAG: hypothetical protein J4F39_19280, partial [Candidatus Latescibacteria bacterium]|nr:hypothetical protein [Candidatus Latescibacterota bacterium]